MKISPYSSHSIFDIALENTKICFILYSYPCKIWKSITTNYFLSKYKIYVKYGMWENNILQWNITIKVETCILQLYESYYNFPCRRNIQCHLDSKKKWNIFQKCKSIMKCRMKTQWPIDLYTHQRQLIKLYIYFTVAQ